MLSATEAPKALRLQPNARIERPLSMAEYYHASIGSSGLTLEPQRETILVLEGEGPDFEPENWQDALDRAAAANPGSRLRLTGHSWRTRWLNDGLPPRLRTIDATDWDGMSSDGAEFIRDVPLSPEHGPTAELILVNRSPRGRLIVMRAHHAVMDGRGRLHFLTEVFRALRGEPLLGSNAGFSDADLMRQVGALPRGKSRLVPTDWLTGMPQGDERGDIWRRVPLETSGRNILARVAGAIAEYTHRHSDRPALIAISADIRRHMPGLVSTANFTNLLFVALHKGEGAQAFRRKLDEIIESGRDAYFPRVLQFMKIVPRSRLDRMVSRTPANYRNRRPVETAAISNLGRLDAAALSCPGFTLKAGFAIPVQGTIFASLVGVGDRIELVLNMPRVLANNGRFDDFLAYLHERLAETDPVR